MCAWNLCTCKTAARASDRADPLITRSLFGRPRDLVGVGVRSASASVKLASSSAAMSTAFPFLSLVHSPRAAVLPCAAALSPTHGHFHAGASGSTPRAAASWSQQHRERELAASMCLPPMDSRSIFADQRPVTLKARPMATTALPPLTPRAHSAHSQHWNNIYMGESM